MKAAVIDENGPPSVLHYRDFADPVPGPDDILIRVEVISLEGGDLLNRRMLPPAAFPHVVGYQAGGTVVAVGSGVTRIRVGQRVAGFAFAGSHAELFRVAEHHAFVLPDGLDMKLGVTMPVTFGTADDALFEFGRLQAGETVLIQGGAGGVGLAAIQLAKAAGARVVATARGRARADRLKDYGADHAIAYDSQDIVAETMRLTAGRGADLAVDMAGGQGVTTLMQALAYRGRLSVVGASSGDLPSFGFFDIIGKSLTVYGILFGLEMHTPRAHAFMARHFQAAAEGRLRMPVDRVFALSQAREAHDYAESGHPFGRVLLVPDA